MLTTVHSLHNKTFQLRSESCTNLWIKRHEFRGKFDTMSVEQNNNRRFNPEVYESRNHGQLCNSECEFYSVGQALNFN